MKVDVVIINWNSGTLLHQCVDSVLASAAVDKISSIIIVDNHSTDDSISILPQHHSIRIIYNNSNVGFSKACNQGFKAVQSDYVLLLNPDTMMYSETIENSILYMDAHPETGIMGCQLLDEAGRITPSCARFPRAVDFVIHGTGLSRLFPKVFRPATLMTDWKHDESREVDQVMGAFMFMRKSIFEHIGFFDERFFVYFEELDFSLRYHQAGGKIFFNAGIKAIHSGMGTTDKVKAFRLFLNLRSRLQYARKHFSTFGFVAVYLSTFSVEFLMRFFMLFFSGRFSEVKDLFKGYGMLWGGRRIGG
jgi:GT2 family glycosyltransferase